MTRKKMTIAIVIVAMLYNFIFDIAPFPVYAADFSVTAESEGSKTTEGIGEGENGEKKEEGAEEGEDGEKKEEEGAEEGEEGEKKEEEGAEEGEDGEKKEEEGAEEGEDGEKKEEGAGEGEDGEKKEEEGAEEGEDAGKKDLLTGEPEDEEEKGRAINKDDDEIIISTQEDLLDLQEWSKEDSLIGKTIILSSDVKDFPDEFTGLGSDEYPFCGKIGSYYVAGVVYNLKAPLICVLGDGGHIEQFKTNTTSPLVTKIVDNAVVSYHNVVISGEISCSGNVGTLASEIGDHVSLSLTDVDLSGVTKVESTSKAAGGIAGVLGEDVTITAQGENKSLSASCAVKGSTHAGGYFGIVQNGFVWDTDTFWFADGVKVEGTGSASQCGQFAGELKSGTVEMQSTKNSIAITANVTNHNGTDGGGLIGVVYGGTTVKSDASLEMICTMGNSANQTVGSYAGGVFGSILAGDSSEPFHMEIPDVTVKALIYGKDAVGGYAGKVTADTEIPNITVQPISDQGLLMISAKDTVGGIIGSLTDAKVLIHSPKVQTATLQLRSTNVVYGGGLIGTIADGAAEISGSEVVVDQLAVSCSINAIRYGYLVGEQNRSLVYFSDPNVTLTENLKGKSPKGGTSIYEVGGIGGVYRNKQLDSGVMIGDGTLSKVGVINYGIPKSGSAYQFSDEKGFECFSIATNSQGYYGKEAFGSSGDASDFLSTVLAGSYEITSTQEIDLSYDNTGIVTLDRKKNDKGLEERFHGSIKGSAGGQAVLKQDIISINVDQRQSCGLFNGLTGDVTFENLKLIGTVDYVEGVGGLAYDIKEGKSLTLKNITAAKDFKSNCGKYVGGLIAEQKATSGSADFTLTAENLTLQSDFDVKTETCSGFFTEMDTAVLDIQNVRLGGSYTNKLDNPSNKNLGGFLGWKWKNIYGTVDGMTVLENTTYTVNCGFGTLLYQASSRKDTNLGLENRLNLKNIDLKNLMVEAKTTASASNAYSALLVRNGSLLSLNVENYSCVGCTVKDVIADKFDEIVGFQNTTDGEIKYGIVSLHSSGKNFPEYFYENQATYVNLTGDQNINNKRTRYYYDVFQKLKDADPVTFEGDTAILDSPEDLLLWSVISYSKKSEIGTFVNIAGNPSNFEDKISKIKIQGTIDLTNDSFYPLQQSTFIVTGDSTATVIFDASKLPDTEGRPNIPPKKVGQHHMLQAGLLCNIYNGCTVSDLTLQGTVSRVIASDNTICTGALVCGSLNTGSGSASEFTNITAKDLKVNGYADLTATNGDGLLVGFISSGKSSFNNICVRYATAPSKYVAAALIGRAGSEKETQITIDFRNMKMDSKTNTPPFRYASFLYYFDHEDSESYSGYGKYLFTENEAKTMVTYGCEPELNNETEYWWESDPDNPGATDPHKCVITATGITASNYLPYTYSGDDILVNPKPVEITEGCGTYEDPYVISDEKQFLMLYKYMNEDIDNNKEFLDGFVMNDMGDDSSFCDGTEASHTERTFHKDGDNSDFPTQEELSHAYYRLGDDIDLSGVMGNYAVFAKNFSGFGSEDHPFCGVWYGKDESDNIHTVTLPDKKGASGQESFGFIRYANGVVLKDMEIKMPDSGTAYINECGGIAIGCVYGGDNIIDNVTVSGSLTKKGTSYNPEIGGLVGRIRKGGLILRNITADHVTGYQWDSNITYQGKLVGAVYDGYVLHDDKDNTNTVSTLNTIGEKQAVSDYTLLNENYFRENTTSLTVTRSGENITFKIPNEASLMLMTMALNSDSLQVIHTDCMEVTGTTKYVPGYTQNSRTRKAKYSSIGNCNIGTEDYLNAVKYDNRMNGSDGSDSADDAYSYPYLYQYMNIAKTDYRKYVNVKTTDQGERALVSMLNDSTYTVWWKLEDGGSTTYDMTTFDKAFRGIGAIYDIRVFRNDGKVFNYAGTFHGSFDGNNNTIQYKINRDTTKRADTTWIQKINVTYSYSLECAGLFNYLVGSGSVAKSIQNVKISGLIQTYYTTGNYSNSYPISLIAGALVGFQEGYQSLTIKNVEVSDFSIGETIHSSDYAKGLSNVRIAGGLVGGVLGASGTDTKISFTGCKVNGTSDKPVTLLAQTAAGGLVGYAGNYVQNVTCTNSIVQYATITATGGYTTDSIVNYNYFGTAGGAVGYYLTKLANADTIVCSISGTTVSDSTVSALSDCGGIVGNIEPSGKTYEGTVTLENNKVENSTISGMRNIGGAIGCIGTTQVGRYLSGTISNTEIVNTVVQFKPALQSTKSKLQFSDSCQGVFVGGLLGFYGVKADNAKNSCLTIENVGVYGTEDGKSKVLIQPANEKLHTYVIVKSGSNEYNLYAGAGGLVGGNFGCMKFPGCKDDKESISNVEICASIADIVYYGAGGIVGFARGSSDSKYTACDFPKTDGYSIKVSGTTISVEQVTTTTVKDYQYGAGGILGVSYAPILGDHNDLNQNTTKTADFICENNTITGCDAGGIVGRAHSSVKLNQVKIDGGSVTGRNNGGGVIGYYTYQYKPSTSNGYSYLSLISPSNEKNLITDVTIQGEKVGGAYGWIVARDANTTTKAVIDGLKINNCDIEGKEASDSYRAGGVIGYEQYVRLEIYDIELEENRIYGCKGSRAGYVGGILGHVNVNYNTQEIRCDQIAIDSTNYFGIKKDGEDTYYLLKNGGTIANPTSADIQGLLNSSTYGYEALKTLQETYGYHVGKFIGGMLGNVAHIYILNQTVTYPDIENGSRNGLQFPVVDVGYNKVAELETNKKLIHVLYSGSNSENSQDNLNNLNEKVSVAYKNSTEVTITELLSSYRLNNETDESKIKGQLDLFQASYPLKVSSAGSEKEGKILRYRIENSTLQQFVDDMADIMTNVSGLTSTMMKILDVEAKRKEWNVTDDTYQELSGQTASIKVTKDSNSAHGFDFQDGTYDTYQDGKVTFTELIFTYGWTDYNGQERKMKYALPIYVEEPIQTYVQSTIVAGQASVIDDIRVQGKTNVDLADKNITMINDSDYTLLLEYFYGNGRKNKGDAVVDKKLQLVSADGSCFEKGTRFVLIDVTNGNQVYYYPATSENNNVKVNMDGMPADRSEISLLDFIGVDGTNYSYQPISGLQDVEENIYTDADGKSLNGYGMEQYLLYVIKPTGTDRTSQYTLHTELNTEDEKTTELIRKALYGVKEADIKVDSIPGITIALTTDNYKTNLSGTMGKDTLITVDVGFSVTASQFYWSQVENAELLDGANNNKYLDVRISLRDPEGNRISLPEGTNFRFMTGGTDENPQYSPYQSISGDSIYYYKDTMTGEFKIRGENGITGDTTRQLKLQLNFENADLLPYTEGEYDICVDLIRSQDPKEPEATKDDTDDENWHYEKTVKAVVVPSLGFAIRVPEEDQNKLAVNTYDSSTTGTHSIPFTVEFDFNDILNVVAAKEKDKVIQKWAGYTYEVTFELFPKKDTGYEETQEERYSGGGMSIITSNGNGAPSEISNGGKLQYTITQQQIKDNTAASGQPITWEGNEVVLDLATLTGWSGDDLSKLTNYKLKATLKVTSPAEEGTGTQTEAEIVTTSDFYIYTVTKLRTSAKGNG